MHRGTNVNWVAMTRAVTVPSVSTVVPRLCSVNSPDRCSVLGSIRSTLLGGLMSRVSAVNTMVLRVAATKIPTPTAHSNSVPRIRRSCTSECSSDIPSPPYRAEGKQADRLPNSRAPEVRQHCRREHRPQEAPPASRLQATRRRCRRPHRAEKRRLKVHQDSWPFHHGCGGLHRRRGLLIEFASTS